MLAPAATVASPCELQAKAKALSASVKMMPPWQIAWPLVMSARTFAAESDSQVDYAPGDVVEFNAPDGRRFAGVLKERGAERVLVDFNHPLAGLPLRFSVHVIGVL